MESKELLDEVEKKINTAQRLTKLEVHQTIQSRAMWGVIALGGAFIANQIFSVIGGP